MKNSLNVSHPHIHTSDLLDLFCLITYIIAIFVQYMHLKNIDKNKMIWYFISVDDILINFIN